MKRIFAVIAISLVIVLASSTINPSVARAWGQGDDYGVHEAINIAALIEFYSKYASTEKYSNSPIDRQPEYKGPVVGAPAASGWRLVRWSGVDKYMKMLETRHIVTILPKTFGGWVEHGGFSADEPNLWACFKHFYNPLATNGPPELTDHSYLSVPLSTVSTPVLHIEPISAKEWAFKHYDNPFSWARALEYYKKAMEIKDTDKITSIPSSLYKSSPNIFRDPDIPTNSLADARNVYLAKAFRALGESMHMMADMTHPAHVRNDSHPGYDPDPLEETVTVKSGIVYHAIGKPAVSSINTAIKSANNIDNIWDILAKFVNSNFYTEDTIYDKETGVNPGNGETPYPHPQLSDLKLDTRPSTSSVGIFKPRNYIKYFDGVPEPVYMIKETLTGYISSGIYLPSSYTIPPSYCESQAGVLLPIAVAANAKLIDLFFPTMELKINAGQKGEVRGNYGIYYPSFELKSEMKHLIDRDIEWKSRSQEIMYSGPAELWRTRKGQETKIEDFNFSGGKIWNPKSLVDYFKIDLGDERSNFTYGDTLFVKVKAGGRIFKSNTYTLPAAPLPAEVKLTISPDPLYGEIEKFYTFTAKATNAPTGARYRWIVDGKPLDTDTNQYQLRWYGAGTKTIKVELIRDDKVIATASAQAIIESAKSPPQVIPPQPTQPQPKPPPMPCGWNDLGKFTGASPSSQQVLSLTGEAAPIGTHQVNVPGPGTISVTLTVWGKHDASNKAYGACRGVASAWLSSSPSVGVQGTVSGAQYFSSGRDSDSCYGSFLVKDAGSVSIRVFPETCALMYGGGSLAGKLICGCESIQGYRPMPHQYEVKVTYNPCGK